MGVTKGFCCCSCKCPSLSGVDEDDNKEDDEEGLVDREARAAVLITPRDETKSFSSSSSSAYWIEMLT